MRNSAEGEKECTVLPLKCVHVCVCVCVCVCACMSSAQYNAPSVSPSHSHTLRLLSGHWARRPKTFL